MNFMDLEKSYDRVIREALWLVLRIYNVGGKPLSGIKSMHINCLAYAKVKKGNSECFRIESGLKQGATCSPWFFNVYMNSGIKEVRVGM